MFAPSHAITAPVTNGYPASLTTQSQASALVSGSEVAKAMAITSFPWTHVKDAVEAAQRRPQVGQVQNVQSVNLQDVDEDKLEKVQTPHDTQSICICSLWEKMSSGMLKLHWMQLDIYDILYIVLTNIKTK